MSELKFDRRRAATVPAAAVPAAAVAFQSKI
jgi:hypothetical protein